MVDENTSPSKGWQEVNAIMTEGGLSEKEEVIMFHQAQSGDTSYEEATSQTDITSYAEDEYTTV